MTDAPSSIIYIAPNAGSSDSGLAALRDMADVDVVDRNTTLSALNGSAVQLASKHDMVVLRTDDVDEADIAAIKALRAEIPAHTAILALTRANTPLAIARFLTLAGVDDVLPDSLTGPELQDQVRKWLNRPLLMAAPMRPERGKIISVSKSRGGIGGTTVAVNLADQLRQSHAKGQAQPSVALVDLDIQFGNIASFLEVETSDILYDFAISGHIPKPAIIQEWAQTGPGGLSVCTAPARMVPFDALNRDQIARFLNLLAEQFDYVVLDLPHVVVDWLGAVLEASDMMLMVTDTSVPSIRQARRLIDTFAEEAMTLPIDMVVNFEKRPMVLRSHHKAAAKVLDRPLGHWIASDAKTAREAIDRGVPVSQVAGRAGLTKGIQRLAKDVRATLSTTQKQTTARPSA